jgi:CDP-diacylglycerol--serine O-phosphatidyltransferase
MRRVRFLAPNLITATSIVFGLAALALAHHGNFRLSGWLIIYAVLGDRLDGFVARKLNATSELGVQLDSFSDFLNFGVAPAFLMQSFLTAPDVMARYDLPFDHGWWRIYLYGACVVWVLAAVFRLARFNVHVEDDSKPTRIFFGIPTTLAGGLLVIWFLTFYKYAEPGHTFGGPKLVGNSLTTPRGVWLALPAAMLVGAYLMASSWRMLKSAKPRSRVLTYTLAACVLSGYVFGWLQILPEYMLWMPTVWIIVFLVWGRFSEEARALEPPPPLFPRSPDRSA